MLPSTTDPAGLSRAQLLRDPLAIGAVGASAVGALYLRDPHQAGAWGYCPLLMMTGLPCPGCGGLRAVNDLTHGDLVGALGSNAMAVVLVVTVVALGIRWGVRRLLGHPVPFLTSRFAVPFAITMGVGFVLLGFFRLTPWGAALRP